MDERNHYPIIIAGSGIAGLSASIYTSRGGNETLVIRGDEPGGQLTLTTEVANYPGFPETVGGQELVKNIEEQARKFGTEFERGIIKSVNDEKRPFVVELNNGTEFTCDAFISASGASARTLGISGEDQLMGYGVSTCATCDGAFFRGEDMAIVGGGDAAFEEAVFLTKFADTVYIIHRREGIRAEEYLQDQVENKIEQDEIKMLLNTEVNKIKGSKKEGVESLELVSHPDGHPRDKLDEEETNHTNLDVGALFIAIGHTPNTDYLQDTNVKLDDKNYIQIKGRNNKYETSTDVDGLFAAGDVFDSKYQQAATAAGSGVKAAMDANNYLEKNID
jgi:thioredoxin-disulfide reductase